MNTFKKWTALIFLFIGYSIWYFSYVFWQTITPIPWVLTLPVFQNKKIEEAYWYLEKYYYGFHERTDVEREDALISALASSLWDKHTSYFNPKDAKEFSESLSWDFEWIGAVIKEHPKGIQIMKVLDNSPAAKNGLLKWDIIIKIESTDTVWMQADAAVEIIRWPKWTPVNLTILSWTTQKTIQLKRDRVMVPSTDAQILTGTTIGHIEIGFFGENTTHEVVQSLKSLTASGVTGIIIDGRNNGWGFLDSAVDITSLFLPTNQLVVATRGIRSSENQDYKTSRQVMHNRDIPIVMLVNNMSASATEIVAGALQDYDRGVIIGQKTYWKWSVQEPFILSDGSMMKITVAKWFTPKDRGIDEKWIEPDIHIELTDDDYKNIYDRQLEWARTILTDMINKKIPVSEYKKEKDSINTLLKDNKIYE